jgi:hypothetical protein
VSKHCSYILSCLFYRSTRSHRKGDDPMAPFQTSVTLSDENRDGQEVIEVQILPQVSNCVRRDGHYLASRAYCKIQLN